MIKLLMEPLSQAFRPMSSLKSALSTEIRVLDLDLDLTQVLQPRPASTTNIIFDSCQFNDTTVTISDHDIALFFGEHGGISSLALRW